MPQFDVQTVLEKLRELGIRPNKKLGQNFLVNVDVCKKIIDQVLKQNPQKIVEVGPGLGALTEFLLEANLSLDLIELDKTFVEFWRSRNIQVFHEDALKMDWRKLNNPQGTVLVSNLPYQISSSLVIDRSVDPHSIDSMVLMFQKEVGQRMTAKHKTPDYGLLTVIAQTFWKVDFVMDVGPKDFYPAPQVASRVLLFKRKAVDIKNPEKFLQFVKKAFAQRRKFMISNLSQNYDKKLLHVVFEKLKIPEKARSEDLFVEQFSKIFEELHVH